MHVAVNEITRAVLAIIGDSGFALYTTVVPNHMWLRRVFLNYGACLSYSLIMYIVSLHYFSVVFDSFQRQWYL